MDTSFQDCDNCKILKTRIVQLQKKISWLNKSKASLSEKLKTTTEGVGSDAGEEEAADTVAEFSSEEDMSQSSYVEEEMQENWSSLEEESHSSDIRDDEECSPDSSSRSRVGIFEY